MKENNIESIFEAILSLKKDQNALFMVEGEWIGGIIDSVSLMDKSKKGSERRPRCIKLRKATIQREHETTFEITYIDAIKVDAIRFFTTKKG